MHDPIHLQRRRSNTFMQNTTKLTALLQAALVLTGIGHAQTSSPHAVNPPSAQAAAPPPQQASAPSQDEAPNTVPVFWVTSVEVLRSVHAPQLDVVRVRGLVTTEGWESVQLVPLTKGTPSDGILDLALVAEAPSENTPSTTYPEVEAIFTIEPGHPFHGVRVHGAANRVVLKSIPGYAESAAPPRNCAGCVGKLFVPRGQTAPAGRSQDTVVREEELPSKLRVIHESDGLGTLDSDLNRITLLLNEKGEIVMAIWD
jgi:hypothetical protein